MRHGYAYWGSVTAVVAVAVMVGGSSAGTTSGSFTAPESAMSHGVNAPAVVTPGRRELRGNALERLARVARDSGVDVVLSAEEAAKHDRVAARASPRRLAARR
jgi:prephenate dehydrogenase